MVSIIIFNTKVAQIAYLYAQIEKFNLSRVIVCVKLQKTVLNEKNHTCY